MALYFYFLKKFMREKVSKRVKIWEHVLHASENGIDLMLEYEGKPYL